MGATRWRLRVRVYHKERKYYDDILPTSPDVVAKSWSIGTSERVTVPIRCRGLPDALILFAHGGELPFLFLDPWVEVAITIGTITLTGGDLADWGMSHEIEGGPDNTRRIQLTRRMVGKVFVRDVRIEFAFEDTEEPAAQRHRRKSKPRRKPTRRARDRVETARMMEVLGRRGP